VAEDPTYTSSPVQRISKRCGRRPKVSKLASNLVLEVFVEEGLTRRWSPAEIHARLVLEYPDEEAMRVSHETIYFSLYVQAERGLKKELLSALHLGRLRRRPRKRGESARRSVFGDVVPISERPPEASDGAFPGRRKGNLIMGALNRSAIVM